MPSAQPVSKNLVHCPLGQSLIEGEGWSRIWRALATHQKCSNDGPFSDTGRMRELGMREFSLPVAAYGTDNSSKTLPDLVRGISNDGTINFGLQLSSDCQVQGKHRLRTSTDGSLA